MHSQTQTPEDSTLSQSSIVNSLLGLIPNPAMVQRFGGCFAVDAETVIAAPEDLRKEAELLAEPLRRATCFPLLIVDPPLLSKPNAICFKHGDRSEGKAEGAYNLTITPRGIIIEANSLAGHFYGTRTLLQLLPPQAVTGRRPHTGSLIRWTIPCVQISDWPRFGWRSFMLDDAHNFQGIQVVKKCLDEMASLKMNVFHWHLIDNHGWRLEIKRYPKLTSVGALSPGEGKGDIAAAHCHSGSPRYYYTQQEVMEVIDYALRRHIRVIPEIEMPGHSNAALRAYPEWSAAGILDVTNPLVIEALKNILDEVMDLFPDAVIHTGGDEVMYGIWETAPQIQAAMQARGIKSSASLQLEFSNQMAAYLAARGHRMMYWADSLEQIPDETNAILQYWQGDPEVITIAARRGFDIINSERFYTYLDYDYGMLSLEKAYAFDPIPTGLDQKVRARILGMGCQAWSVYIPSPTRLDHQVFPRLAACAEVAWSAKENKNYEDFTKRLKIQEQRWDMAGVRYARGRSIPYDELRKRVLDGQRVGEWIAEEVGAGSVWHNNMPSNNHDFDITEYVINKGRYLVAFVHRDGIDTLSVRRVEILEDGNPIAADWGGHMLISIEPGNAGQPHLFDLTLPAVKPGAHYALRANYFRLKGTNSSGDIYMINVGDLPPDCPEGLDY